RRHDDRYVSAGIYNRSHRRIADVPKREPAFKGRYMILPDSNASSFAVMDTSGRLVLPYTPADTFWLMKHAVVTADTLQKHYIIYHLDKKKSPDTAQRVFSNHDQVFRGARAKKYLALPTWSPERGFLTWIQKKGTGLLNMATGQDTFMKGIVALPWSYNKLLARYPNSSLWGVMSQDAGKWLIAPELDTIYYQGQYYAYRQHGKAGLRNIETLEVIVPPIWDSILMEGNNKNREA